MHQHADSFVTGPARLSSPPGAGTLPSVKPTPQHLAYAVAVVGALVGMAGGYLRVTTPEAAQCAVELADKAARLDLTTQAMGTCERALDLCSGSK